MSEMLSQISKDLSDTVEAAGRSVLRVEGRERLPASGFAWAADGVVVTAHHVLQWNENISVGLANGETVKATLVGRDPATDLAVLRTEGAELTEPDWKEPEGLRVGNIALALGRPGKTVQATLGIVSALGDSWRTRAGGAIDHYLQTDVVMYPGFSGGSLVDASGSVVGLNTSALARGVTVSVPVPTIRRVVDTLLAHGRIRRGYLGVGAQVVRLPENMEPRPEQKTGLLLVSVDPGSPAAQGGLMLGDTVLALDGRPVRRLDDLLGALGGGSVGASAAIRILRGGVVQELTVVIGERN